MYIIQISESAYTSARILRFNEPLLISESFGLFLLVAVVAPL